MERVNCFYINKQKCNAGKNDSNLHSAKLLEKALIIHKISSGSYFYLPLGQRIINKINNIIREEHAKNNIMEVLSPTIHSSEIWEKSGRINTYGKEMLKIKDRKNKEIIYSPTAEEIFTILGCKYIKSYKDMPLVIYNIQSKFRDEIRPKNGILRCKEFIMKDAYSFDVNVEQAHVTYEKMFNLYKEIFKRINCEIIPVKASCGEIGGDLSHEFHILSENGDAEICWDKKKCKEEIIKASFKENIYAVNKEIHSKKIQIHSEKSIEICHMFFFGDKYSKIFNGEFTDQNGKKNFFQMGSYGIGVSRLLGAIAEKFHDEKGLKWPLSISPFKIIVVNLSNSLCEKIKKVIDREDVIYDDRKNVSVGEKLHQSELTGYPYRITINKNSIEKDSFELYDRFYDKKQSINFSEMKNFINKILS